MIAADEDALACDFMETYGILDFRALPVSKAAVLATGLRANSRIKMIINGEKVDSKILLLGTIADALHTLVWFQSEDGANRINRPASIVRALLGTAEMNDNEIVSFDSPEEFERAKREIMRGW